MQIIIDLSTVIRGFFTNYGLLTIWFKILFFILETSLTGKALDFGSNEYGFESRVSNLLYNYANAYTINMVNINAAKKTLAFNTVFTKKVFALLKIFKKYGMVKDYKLLNTNDKRVAVRVYLIYYRYLPLNKNIKLISTPSRTFYVSLNSLKFLEKRTGSSIFLISTTKGIVTHKVALQNNTGGVLVGYFAI
jgi:ribosomal protein S8